MKKFGEYFCHDDYWLYSESWDNSPAIYALPDDSERQTLTSTINYLWNIEFWNRGLKKLYKSSGKKKLKNLKNLKKLKKSSDKKVSKSWRNQVVIICSSWWFRTTDPYFYHKLSSEILNSEIGNENFLGSSKHVIWTEKVS